MRIKIATFVTLAFAALLLSWVANGASLAQDKEQVENKNSEKKADDAPEGEGKKDKEEAEKADKPEFLTGKIYKYSESRHSTSKKHPHYADSRPSSNVGFESNFDTKHGRCLAYYLPEETRYYSDKDENLIRRFDSPMHNDGIDWNEVISWQNDLKAGELKVLEFAYGASRKATTFGIKGDIILAFTEELKTHKIKGFMDMKEGDTVYDHDGVKILMWTRRERSLIFYVDAKDTRRVLTCQLLDADGKNLWVGYRLKDRFAGHFFRYKLDPKEHKLGGVKFQIAKKITNKRFTLEIPEIKLP